MLTLPLEQCVLTPPLGSSRRFLKFPGGERLQVDDPAVLAFFDDTLRSHLGLQWVHFIESHWRLVAACVAGLVVCVWALMAFALPHFAKKIALATPAGVMDRISDDTLKLLDNRFFALSELSPGRKAEVGKIFSTLCVDFVPSQGCNLVFRKGGTLGANAFALPSGLVIVTDELVDFAENNDELAGVLAHELVHVKERHGVRHVIQQAGVFMLISTLLGDMTSLTSLGSALPMMLVESGYSRQFEQEADENASRYFLEHDRSVQPYKDMLYRLTKDQQLPGVASFLASHPGAEERLQAIEAVERGD
ncbi:MAG: M48 family metallopeptidase [Proteobacteria bacterium]|nr:M48 family metallopeptidase [Pseudomonadota bacterium]MBU1641215.1 M48 family metallopeptidase [Pseudomonadota bacterium]